MKLTDEILDIVDRNDNIIGTSPKKEAYTKGLNIRIVHILVIHPITKEIFIQKRSTHVRYLPNFLCTSA